MNIKEYKELLEKVKEEFPDRQEALTILHEIRKDDRSEEMKREKAMQPATQRQKDYLKNLGVDVPKGLTKIEASRLISEVTDGKKD